MSAEPREFFVAQVWYDEGDDRDEEPGPLQAFEAEYWHESGVRAHVYTFGGSGIAGIDVIRVREVADPKGLRR